MMKFFAAYAATLSGLVALDMLWLGIVAKAHYAAAIAHLLAPRPGVTVAMVFYSLFAQVLVVQRQLGLDLIVHRA